MDNNNTVNQKDQQSEAPQDPILSEMKKTNFNLWEIASSLAVLKWIAIIVVLTLIAETVCFFSLSTQITNALRPSEEWRGSSYTQR